MNNNKEQVHDIKDVISKWSKEDIYKAYLSEYETRVRLNTELNNERRRIYELEETIKWWQRHS